MNDNTTKLLEQMGQKVGTTTEYLWNILLRQAPIYATLTLFKTIGVMFFGWTLWKIHKKLLKKTSCTYPENGYDKHEGNAFVLMFVATIVFILLFVNSFSSIVDIVNGFFNPEYWALKEVLNSLK